MTTPSKSDVEMVHSAAVVAPTSVGKAEQPHSDEDSTRPPSCSSVDVDLEERTALCRKESGAQQEVPARSWLQDKAKISEAEDEGPMFLGLSMKWVSLIALTVQTSAQVLLIKWARAGGLNVPFLNTTVVAFTEVLKTLASFVLVAMECGSFSSAALSVYEHFSKNPAEILKAAVPALIYTIQNNLMFYSLEKLSAPVQQVLYQMKILTTAGLGVIMLGKSLSATKWFALVCLALGVGLVQWPRQPTNGQQELDDDSHIGTDQLYGFLAVLTACVTSGFAAVYIQKMLQQTTASIWMRNIQFGIFGSVMAFVVSLGRDSAKIHDAGLTQGYSLRVYLVVCMNAFGGLLCAAMLKYAGATLGCFSTALSIILTCTLSATLLQDFVPDQLFVLGTALAIGASLLFGLGLPARLTDLVDSIRKPTSATEV